VGRAETEINIYRRSWANGEKQIQEDRKKREGDKTGRAKRGLDECTGKRRTLGRKSGSMTDCS